MGATRGVRSDWFPQDPSPRDGLAGGLMGEGCPPDTGHLLDPHFYLVLGLVRKVGAQGATESFCNSSMRTTETSVDNIA